MYQIYTAVVNRPNFITYQKKTFDKFLNHPYTFTVFDDSIDDKITEEIKNLCNNIGITYIKTPRNLKHHDPAIACGAVIQWGYENYIKNTDDLVMFIDSDMFLFDYFNADEYTRDCDLAAVPQYRNDVCYPWNGLMFLNMASLPDKEINFMPGVINGIQTDVGGNVYHMLKRRPETFFKHINHTSHIMEERGNLESIPERFRGDYKDYFCLEILMGKFLHYGSATNWKHVWRSIEDPTKEKTAYVYNFLDTILG